MEFSTVVFDGKKELCINIDEIEGVPRNALHLLVAQVLAEENLEVVNTISEKAHPIDSFYSRYGKRGIDLVLSLLAFGVTLPFNFALGVLTYKDVGAPIFYHEKRIGKDGKQFEIYKFRNMTNECDENGVLLPAHERVTKFGRVMRKYSLDELLNFWFIVTGKMSFIGPRPLHPEYLERYSDRHWARLAVRPGLECPALDGKSFAVDWVRQFENDVKYVESVSLVVDIRQMANLFKLVFNRKSNIIRGNAVRGGFMGYGPNGECINSRAVPVRYVDRALSLYLEHLK